MYQLVSSFAKTMVFSRLDPRLREGDSQTGVFFNCKQDFLHDCRVLQSFGESGYLPKYITRGEIVRSEDGLYPGGYILILVMTKLDGIFIITGAYAD